MSFPRNREKPVVAMRSGTTSSRIEGFDKGNRRSEFRTFCQAILFIILVPKSEHEKSSKSGRTAGAQVEKPAKADATHAGGAMPTVGMGLEPGNAGQNRNPTPLGLGF